MVQGGKQEVIMNCEKNVDGNSYALNKLHMLGLGMRWCFKPGFVNPIALLSSW